MSGRGGIFVQVQGGWGRGRGIDDRDRGGNTWTVTSWKKGSCAGLGDNIFTYNKKGAAYQQYITLHQIFKHIGTIYVKEISNEVHKLTAVIIIKHVYAQDKLDKQVINER